MINKMIMSMMGSVLIVLTGCAKDTVTLSVKDLVGIRGSSGENALEARGFVWVKTEKSDESAYSYWEHDQSGQCLKVSMTDGRYASLVKTVPFECKKRQ